MKKRLILETSNEKLIKRIIDQVIKAMEKDPLNSYSIQCREIKG